MGLTQIFIIICVGSTILAGAVIFGMESDNSILQTLAKVVVTIFSVTAVAGLVGAVWSWNSNSRETHNRCVEDSGIVMRVNESMHCLEEAPKIKFKM